MLTSLAFIFLAVWPWPASAGDWGCPRIIGMLFTGILLGPNVFNLLDSSILLISPQLRQMALIIILLKAGLSLNLSDLRQVGRPAVMMSFVPASFEILAFLLFGPFILGNFTGGGGSSGLCAGSRFTGSGHSADGSADGGKIRYG